MTGSAIVAELLRLREEQNDNGVPLRGRMAALPRVQARTLVRHGAFVLGEDRSEEAIDALLADVSQLPSLFGYDIRVLDGDVEIAVYGATWHSFLCGACHQLRICPGDYCAGACLPVCVPCLKAALRDGRCSITCAQVELDPDANGNAMVGPGLRSLT